MAYKNIQNYFSFDEIAIVKNADNNRSLLFLGKIDSSIDWEPVEHLLIKFSHKYDSGDKAKFPKIMTNLIDIMFRQLAFNLIKGAKILEVIPV